MIVCPTCGEGDEVDNECVCAIIAWQESNRERHVGPGSGRIG